MAEHNAFDELTDALCVFNGRLQAAAGIIGGMASDEEIIDVTEREAHQPAEIPPHGLLSFHMEPSEKTTTMEQGKAVRYRGQVYVIQWRRERKDVTHPIVEFGLLLK